MERTTPSADQVGFARTYAVKPRDSSLVRVAQPIVNGTPMPRVHGPGVMGGTDQEGGDGAF